MFGINKIRPGYFAFVVKKDELSNFIIIGRIVSENDKLIKVKGSYLRPTGLVERVKAGRARGKPEEALNNPDPNNCVFLIIDKIDSGHYEEFIDPKIDKVIPINENRYYVLDGWIKESMSELFSNFFNSVSEEERLEARNILIKKMNSLVSQELREHVYAVARSSKIL